MARLESSVATHTRRDVLRLYQKRGTVADLSAPSDATDLIESLYMFSCDLTNATRSLFVFSRERHRLQCILEGDF
jgi:hypothetical protein